MLFGLIIQPCRSDDLRDCVNFTQNTNLRHLRLSHLNLTNEVCLDIVSQITSFDLETIELNLSAWPHIDVEKVPWNQIAQILTQRRFMKLRKVRLHVKCCRVTDFQTCFCIGWLDRIRPQLLGLGRMLDLSMSRIEEHIQN